MRTTVVNMQKIEFNPVLTAVFPAAVNQASRSLAVLELLNPVPRPRPSHTAGTITLPITSPAGPHDPALLSLLTSPGPLPLNLLPVSPREPALGSTNTFQQSSLASEAWAVSAVRLKPCPAVDADSLPLFSQHQRPTSLMPGASVQGVGGVGCCGVDTTAPRLLDAN
ncbi:unnamed protein product [Leuciscus chuanchicus]